MTSPTPEHQEQARANNRLEEIRARWRAERDGQPLFNSQCAQTDINYLLSLLDARPAEAADARAVALEMVHACYTRERVPLTEQTVASFQSSPDSDLVDHVAEAITTYANQQVEAERTRQNLDWNRLLSGDYRALDPEHQTAFDAVRERGEGRWREGVEAAAKRAERFFGPHDKRLITAVKVADEIRRTGE